MGTRYITLVQILSWMYFLQTAKGTQNSKGSSVYVTDNGNFMSNGWAAAGLVTNNLLPAQKQNYLSSFFQHKRALTKTFLKEIRVRKTKRCSPESCPEAHIPFSSPHSPYFMLRTFQVFLQPQNLPQAHLVFPFVFKVALGGNYRNFIFTQVGILQAPQTHITCTDLLSLPALTVSMVTLWPVPPSCTTHLCRSQGLLTPHPQPLFSFGSLPVKPH